MTRRLALLAVVAVLLFLAAAPWPRLQVSTVGGWRASLTPPVRVIDGDTLALGDQRIRLYGIDAPERSQGCLDARGQPYPCGRYAALALEALVRGRDLSCAVLSRDRYGRDVARCRAGGVDLGAALVEHGWAIAFRKYSLDYVPAEETARGYGSGIWAGSFTEPAEYRRERRTR